jgi:GNAT superfamily N-acetyltransferase
MHHERHDRDILVTTDPARLDLDTIHDFLSRTSYWAAGIPREVMERSIRHSICFGAFDRGRQVGFARVVSDRATFAYVCDVFVLDGHRSRGVGHRIMACITSHPELQNLRLWTCSRGTPTALPPARSRDAATRTDSWSGAPSAPTP